MKKKNNKLIWVIVVLLIAFGTMIYFYLKPVKVNTNESDADETRKEVAVDSQTITKEISSSRRD